MHLRIILILTVISFESVGQVDTTFADFLNLFPNKKLEAKHYVKFLKIDHPYLENQLKSERRTAEKILFRTDNFIAVLIDNQCGAGGLCESKTIYTFTLEGKKIDEERFSADFADCGFRKKTENIYYDKDYLVSHFYDWEGDCIDEITTSETSTIKEYVIDDFGNILIEADRNIDLRREFSIISTKVFKEEELKDFSADTLAIMRNEIFASYGYKFKTERWNHYFSNKPWYKPEGDAVAEEELSFIERKNLELIKRIESAKK